MTTAARAEVEALRQDYITHGWRPVAVRSRSKVPLEPEWQHTRGMPTFSPVAMSTGFLCDGLRAADITSTILAACDVVVSIIEDVLGPAGPIREPPDSARKLLLYRALEGEPNKRTIALPIGKIEFLGWHNQALGDGIHPDGRPYYWPHGGPDTVHLADVPAITEAQIDEVERRLLERFPLPAEEPKRPEPPPK